MIDRAAVRVLMAVNAVAGRFARWLRPRCTEPAPEAPFRTFEVRTIDDRGGGRPLRGGAGAWGGRGATPPSAGEEIEQLGHRWRITAVTTEYITPDLWRGWCDVEEVG